jgi:hypothetical protein
MQKWLAEELTRRDPTLVGFWPLIGDMKDYSGLSNHGQSYINSLAQPSPNQYLRESLGRPSLSCQNSNYVKAGANKFNFFVGVNNKYTLSFWAQIYQLGASYVLSYGDANTGGWAIKYDSVPKTLTWQTYNGFFLSSTYSVSLVEGSFSFSNFDTWRHFVIVYEPTGDGNTGSVEIFIDGRSFGRSLNMPIYIGGGNITDDIVIGAYTSGATYYPTNGSISCVRIYRRCLNRGEIKDLHDRELSFNEEYDGWKKGLDRTNSGITLFGQGSAFGETPSSGTTTLYVGGVPAPTWIGSTTLFTEAIGASSGNTSLYTGGYFGSSGNIPLYIKYFPEARMNLFMAGGDPEEIEDGPLHYLL